MLTLGFHNMKILFIAPTLPINNGSGGAIRSYQLYEELKTFAQVDVMTADSMAVNSHAVQKFTANHNYVGHMDIPWQRNNYYKNIPLNETLKKITQTNGYDYIFIRYYNTAYWLGALALNNLVLDCDDCFIELTDQLLLTRKNVIESMSLGILELIHEKINLALAKLGFMYVIRKYVKSIAPIKHVIFSRKSERMQWQSNFTLIANKIAVMDNNKNDTALSVQNDEVKMLFIGVLNYAPNFMGLDHFIRKVWPTIIQSRPKAKLKIVGQGLAYDFIKVWENYHSIELCGFVENIDDVYADVDFSIVPVYAGSGTHIKVIESLMRGKTVVTAWFAHRGYEHSLLDEESLFVAKTDADYAKKVIELIDNPELREKMSAYGREQVIKHHAINASNFALKNLLKPKSKNEIITSAAKPEFSMSGGVVFLSQENIQVDG
jgi:glycosyltransferase involved in cell wall biosynthesis